MWRAWKIRMQPKQASKAKQPDSCLYPAGYWNTDLHILTGPYSELSRLIRVKLSFNIRKIYYLFETLVVSRVDVIFRGFAVRQTYTWNGGLEFRWISCYICFPDKIKQSSIRYLKKIFRTVYLITYTGVDSFYNQD